MTVCLRPLGIVINERIKQNEIQMTIHFPTVVLIGYLFYCVKIDKKTKQYAIES